MLTALLYSVYIASKMSPANEADNVPLPETDPDVLMLVEIRFETGLCDDIEVRTGDDPEELAKVYSAFNMALHWYIVELI